MDFWFTGGRALPHPRPFTRPRRLTCCTLSALAVLAGAPLTTLADPGTPTGEVVLDEVAISTTRSTTQEEDSPRALGTVDRETLTTRTTTGGVQALLAEMPGIDYARSGGLGGQIVLRGFNSNSARSMLAIDGDRFRGRSTLEFNLIDPNAVERIEVIRGPASALWGADAMNGVVNVITRRARVDRDAPFKLDARVRAVEYNSVNDGWATRGELVGGGQGFDVLVGATLRRADDYDTPAGRAENSRFHSGGLDFRLGFSPSALTRWELAGRFQETTTGRAGGLGAAPGAPWLLVSEAPIREQYLKLGVETREAGAFADVLEASLYVRKLDTDIYQRNATAANGSLAAVTVNQHIEVHTPTVFGGRINATRGLGNHLLAYGGDFYMENFNSRRVQVTRTNTATGAVLGSTDWSLMERGSQQTNLGFFVSDDWALHPAFSLSGALRWDVLRTVIDAQAIPGEAATVTQAIDRVGRTRQDTPLTGSLGGVWKFTPTLSAVAQVSQGYRAPSGNERTLTSASGTIVTVPSPDLKPEQSTTYETGLRVNAEGVKLQATAYQSRYRDLIVLTVVDALTRQRQNVARAEITGLELSGTWQLNKALRLGFTATATRGTNESTGTPLEAISPLSGRVSLRHGEDGGPWFVEAALRGAQGRDRVDPATERPRAGFAALDLYGSVDLGQTLGAQWKNWRLTLGLENAFDRRIVNQVAAEDLRYSQGLIGNPLLEPGRAFVAKLVQAY